MPSPLPQPVLPEPGVRGDGRPLLVRGARLLDGRGELAETDLLAVDGRIEALGSGLAADGATVVDAAGATLLPGLVDAHIHLSSFAMPAAPRGEPAYEPGVKPYAQAGNARATLAAGITTVRDVGGYGEELFHLRRAIAGGMASGPRILLSGRIVSATSPGGRKFGDMYLTADGPDAVRAAVRQVLADGADFVKVMATGALTVDREPVHPAQLTRPELEAIVDEAHRLGVRVAAHAEGLAGIRLAVEVGVDTVEHGDLLHEDPALADAMAERGIFLVPTLSVFHAVGDDPRCCFTHVLVEQAERLREAAYRSVGVARAAGVRIAMGFDDTPHGENALEAVRLADAGLSSLEAIDAATRVAADACGLGQIGRLEVGAVADLLLVDEDPLVDLRVLLDPARRRLVVLDGVPVAGTALDPSPPWEDR
jgi:imidazolonepropionase-like amidohydrolase